MSDPLALSYKLAHILNVAVSSALMPRLLDFHLEMSNTNTRVYEAIRPMGKEIVEFWIKHESKRESKSFNPPVKEGFPKTGLEEVLTYIAMVQTEQPEALSIKEALQLALSKDSELKDLCYNEEVENRHYLPKEIEALPESERPAAVLTLLQEIKSSSPFLKGLSH